MPLFTNNHLGVGLNYSNSSVWAAKEDTWFLHILCYCIHSWNYTVTHIINLYLKNNMLFLCQVCKICVLYLYSIGYIPPGLPGCNFVFTRLFFGWFCWCWYGTIVPILLPCHSIWTLSRWG